MLWYDNHRKKLYIKESLICREISLRPKEFGIWDLLCSYSNQPISRQLMCDEVWGGRYVTDFTINQTINQLRKKIGPLGKDVIVTFPRKGYAIDFDLVSVSPVTTDFEPGDDKGDLTESRDRTLLPCSPNLVKEPITADCTAENRQVPESQISGNPPNHKNFLMRLLVRFLNVFK